MCAIEHQFTQGMRCSALQVGFETKPAPLFHNGPNQAELFQQSGGLMTKNEDRRVQRTQQLLRTALFALIQEKGFEKLSVQEIIDRANVGRATFYAHFDNKEDLLLSGFDAFRESLRQRQREARSCPTTLDEQAFAFSRDMIAHVDEYRHLFKAMAGKNSGAAVQNVLRKLVVDFVRDDLKAMVAGNKSRRAVTDAVVEFIAGGLFGLLVWRLGSKDRLSIEELNALFRRFAIPAAKAAL
jgi:AcrR family transcriptional regulator